MRMAHFITLSIPLHYEYINPQYPHIYIIPHATYQGPSAKVVAVHAQ